MTADTCIWKNEAKDRQGTDKLVLALSKRLSIMINKRYTLDSVHIVDSSLPTLNDVLNRHLRNIEKKLRDLPPPVSPATAQYTVSRLCQDFIGMIEAKTEPNPEVVRKVFTDLAKELIGTHPIFDVNSGFR